jgi:hypothetical protein
MLQLFLLGNDQEHGASDEFFGAIHFGAVSEFGNFSDNESLDVVDFEVSFGFDKDSFHGIYNGYPEI